MGFTDSRHRAGGGGHDQHEAFRRLHADTAECLIFVFYGLSFTAFTFALKRLDLSLSYAIWAGAGTALIAAIGVIWFKEPVTALKIASVLLIVGGIVGLNLSMRGAVQ